jgi:hypothetical protein
VQLHEALSKGRRAEQQTSNRNQKPKHVELHCLPKVPL